MVDSIDIQISNALLNIVHCRGPHNFSISAMMREILLATESDDSDEAFLNAVINYHKNLDKGDVYD